MTDIENVLDRARFKDDGLLPAIIQAEGTGEVLMLGYMDREALRRTLTEGRVTYWSRSRQEYWRKGDTSGHVQYVRAAALDCDGDTLLVTVEQVGAACHTGDRTCFDADRLDVVVGPFDSPPARSGSQFDSPAARSGSQFDSPAARSGSQA
ncbi:MAG: phosphoribosyl-AMP cyclohydrolase [Microbacteriaceae bacterium]|nr:phosphoribosyl-AMP cyclohydrolase [Microbacteriaceae bacterium]